VTPELFDRRLRALRRDRAARTGPELFLYDRAFRDCLDRLADIVRTFDHCLLIGCPSPGWPQQLKAFAREADVMDPGSLFAATAGGRQLEEDRFDFGADRYDLVVAIGTLDSVNDLPLALQLIRRALRTDGLLIGAIAGGNSLPAMRTSLIEAGRSQGRVVARTHPRIEASALAGLLSSAGFSMPVVDVDRVTLRYSDLASLVGDLRAMGVTSMLSDRPPPLTRAEFRTAGKVFERLGAGGRTEELIEILHFVGWNK
jgi:SAM-dependent methyltransferase